MATIGLDKLYYAKITEGANGDETYAAPAASAEPARKTRRLTEVDGVLTDHSLQFRRTRMPGRAAGHTAGTIQPCHAPIGAASRALPSTWSGRWAA